MTPIVATCAVTLPDARPASATRSRWQQSRAAVASAFDWLFGSLTLVLGLACLSAVPLGQFLTLGYLLEAGGRVARTGRLREGLIGIRLAARLGRVALAALFLWLPLWAISTLATSAEIIDPNGPIAQRWRISVMILAAIAVLHWIAGCCRGGRLRHFLSPLNSLWLIRRMAQGGLYGRCRDAFWNHMVALRLPYYFWLGLRGYLGALLWLAVPIALLGQGHRWPVVGILGGVLLALVVLYVPFLQLRLARENHWRAVLQWRAVRAEFRRAPWACLLAFWVCVILATPLYLLKIEVIPRDLMFLENLVFLAFIFPAKLALGWASGRARRQTKERHGFFCWTARLAMLPAAVAYAGLVFLSQHLTWGGIGSLFEQHAFLLPVPFTDLPD